MDILNQPKILQDDVTNKLRNAIMHRGLWMGLILKEVKERGHGLATDRYRWRDACDTLRYRHVRRSRNLQPLR